MLGRKHGEVILRKMRMDTMVASELGPARAHGITKRWVRPRQARDDMASEDKRRESGSNRALCRGGDSNWPGRYCQGHGARTDLPEWPVPMGFARMTAVQGQGTTISASKESRLDSESGGLSLTQLEDDLLLDVDCCRYA